ncbi:MAG: cation diffusion facilitator family transporter [Anaerolineales bacterium]|jgi:cobalt-zinc-cadmium efflux system protein
MAHNHPSGDTARIKAAFFLNLAFTVLEVFGGIWTNSLAILSDALHDLGDSISLGMSWYLENYAERGDDKRYSYGYRRYSMLSALVNTIVLIVGSLFIIWQAVPRLIEPEPTDAQGMALFSILGILANGLAVLRLRGGKTLNARVAAWHLIEDVLGWVAVLVVSIVLLFTDFYFLDPLLSILITLYILFNVIKNLRRTLALFLQAVPDEVDLEQVESRLLSIDNVRSSHHTHVWSLDGERHVLTTHLVVEQGTTREQVECIKAEIKHLSRELDFYHTTVEIDFEEEGCSMAEDL